MTENKEYLSVKDIQGIFKISRTSAYNLMTLRGFPSFRIGRKYLVEKNDFYEFIEAHKNTQILI